MKHYSDDSKKLIKNVVSLVVSALLLAAATFAWFSSNEGVNSPTFSGSFVATVQLDYMHLNLSSSPKFLDLSSSALTVRDRSGASETTSSIADFVTGASGWTSSSGTAWNIDSMYPGEFGAYKICFISDGVTRKLEFDTVTCANTDARESIYVYALAQKTASGSNTATTIASVTTTLDDLLDGASQKITVLSGIASSRGDTVTIYYVIGMPASDSAGPHDDLQETGATLSIVQVDAVAAS